MLRPLECRQPMGGWQCPQGVISPHRVKRLPSESSLCWFPCLITTFSEPAGARNDLGSVGLSTPHREMSFTGKQCAGFGGSCCVQSTFGLARRGGRGGRLAFTWRLSRPLPVGCVTFRVVQRRRGIENRKGEHTRALQKPEF